MVCLIFEKNKVVGNKEIRWAFFGQKLILFTSIFSNKFYNI